MAGALKFFGLAHVLLKEAVCSDANTAAGKPRGDAALHRRGAGPAEGRRLARAAADLRRKTPARTNTAP
jgi:hypothetical protein